MIKNLSVFFPVFNEEGNIENAVNNALKVLDRLKLDYEIIIVNDGSTDQTAQVVEKLIEGNHKIRVINHPYNLGYGEALKSGFYNAKYDTIVYTDGDGQFDFSEVTKFLERLDTADLIIGYRIKRRDPFFRILFKKGWRLSLWTFFGMTLRDVDCGFKMVKKKVLEEIPKLESQRGAMINAELAIKAKKYGFKVTQVGVNHYPRLSGKPTGASIPVIIRSYVDLMKLWWKLKDQRILFIFLVLILLLGAFLRFYNLPGYMTFLGDEGRDALVIKKILVSYDFPLIGPPTSIGNIYLGPFYYYMMALPMAIFWLNPVAAAGMVSLIGVVTVYLIYYLGKLWFGREAGLFASFLYAISPVTIIHSKSSWNPNPAPFFALLSILGLYKVHQTGNFLWLILTGFCLAAALQMHYLALILIPVAIVLWLHEVWSRNSSKKPSHNLARGTLLAILAFFLLMFPLVLFDLRHNFLNYKAVTNLLISERAVEVSLFTNLSKIPNLYSHSLIGRHLTAENFYLTLAVSASLLLPLLWAVRRIVKGFIQWPQLALGVWLIVGLIGLSFYQHSIYDHYLGFLNPVPFLLFGALFVITKNRYWQGTLIILVVLLAMVNFKKNPLLFPPNNQLLKTQQVANFIISQSEGRDFNFALLSKNNYDDAYEFYLDLYGHKPKEVPFEITNQLFVVCEDPVCEPINNPKYEIAAFGWIKIGSQYEIAGVKVYKLIPHPSGRL